MSNHLTVGPVLQVHPWWQSAIPIRTLEHVAWVFGIGGVALVAGGLLTDWRHHLPIAICAVAGTLPSFASNLPATMRIEWSSIGPNPFVTIDESLYRAGWQKVERNKAQALYVQHLPRLLRWRTGEISIESAPFCAVARGPRIGLSMLRKNLLVVARRG